MKKEMQKQAETLSIEADYPLTNYSDCLFVI